MKLITTLYRRLASSQSGAVSAKRPAPLRPELLKAVSGGNGGAQAPRSGW